MLGTLKPRRAWFFSSAARLANTGQPQGSASCSQPAPDGRDEPFGQFVAPAK